MNAAPGRTFHFQTKIVSPQKGWYGLFIPNTLLGVRGRVRLKGTLNGKSFAAHASPMGDGTHGIVLNREMRAELGLKGDEQVTLEVLIDPTPADIAIPEDLLAALKKRKGAEAAFRGMAYSHRKEYIRWIQEAKRPETRTRRLQETVERVVKGEKFS